jgi:hypothetical protein
MPLVSSRKPLLSTVLSTVVIDSKKEAFANVPNILYNVYFEENTISIRGSTDRELAGDPDD